MRKNNDMESKSRWMEDGSGLLTPPRHGSLCDIIGDTRHSVQSELLSAPVKLDVFP